jgi:hypothetical protein
MATFEIDRNRWKPFFDSFTRKHDRWLTTIEVMDPEIGDQIQVHELPLQGITAQSEGNRNVEISVLDEAEHHLLHTIDAPRRVWLKQTEDGVDEVLEFETAQGATLVHIRAAVH